MIRRYHCLLCLLFLSGSLLAQNSGDNLLDRTTLHEVRLTFAEPNYWEILTNNFNQHADPNTPVPYLMASVTIDGTTVDSIGVRQKGFTSHGASETKKPLKLDFNEFVAGKRYDGLRKINLNNATADPGMQRDFICYDLMNAMGVNAPRVAFTRVYLNDEYYGLYQLVEQVDKEFLQNNFEESKGNLFKNMGWFNFEFNGDDTEAYRTMQLKTNRETDDYAGLINFIDILNNASEETFPAAIEAIFDVDRYLKTLAVDVATDNWDSNLQHGRNWYMYEDTTTGVFNWIPWDYNLSFGADLFGGGGGDECVLFADPAFLLNGTTTIQFYDAGFALEEPTFTWDFGDGSPVSAEQNPVHTYATAGEYEVCVTMTLTADCFSERCKRFNTTTNLDECPSIIDGSYGGPADSIFALLLTYNPTCCEMWGEDCEDIKTMLTDRGGSGGGGFGSGFAIDQRGNEERILISRLLAVPDFYDRYIRHFCNLMNNHFTSEKYDVLMAEHKALIEGSVADDPHFLFSFEIFEQDFGEEGLRQVIADRTAALLDELDMMGGCAPVLPNIRVGDLAINEFVADNDSISGINDPDGGYPDWIELYNNTTAAIDLSDTYLSDKSDNLLKWQFPTGTTIPGGGYLIIWADEDLDQQGLHANFKLSKNGEAIYLSNADESSIDSIGFGEQTTNVSLSRFPNGTGPFLAQHTTHGYSNDTPVTTRNVIDALRVNVYPNPVGDQLQVGLPTNGTQQYTVEIFSITGQQVVADRQISGPLAKLEVSNLVPGFYFLRVRGEDGKRGVMKFSKR
ncbi:MAG: CotH kinase family protein [Lewinella sp.]